MSRSAVNKTNFFCCKMITALKDRVETHQREGGALNHVLARGTQPKRSATGFLGYKKDFVVQKKGASYMMSFCERMKGNIMYVCYARKHRWTRMGVKRNVNVKC